MLGQLWVQTDLLGIELWKDILKMSQLIRYMDWDDPWTLLGGWDLSQILGPGSGGRCLETEGLCRQEAGAGLKREFWIYQVEWPRML